MKHLEKRGLNLHHYIYSTGFIQGIMAGMREVEFDGVSVSNELLKLDLRADRYKIKFQ